jgi:DNA-binding PadR family transcriptional regulator
MVRQPDCFSLGLRYALLGLLARRPLTGYEILKRFTRSIVFFWNAKRSQIYAELRRIEHLGLVTSQVEIQQGRPNKRKYTMGPAGGEALRKWLDAPAPLQPIKDEMLLKTFFSDPLPPARVADRLRRRAEEHDRIVAEFEGIKASLEARWGPLETTADRPLAFRYLVLEHGIRFERLYADWCRWAATAVEARPAVPPEDAASPTGADFVVSAAR